MNYRNIWFLFFTSLGVIGFCRILSMTTNGAFKFRGACNAVFSLNDEEASKGVITHSRFVIICSNSRIQFFLA
jgi:hypothetical protein